MIVSIKKRTKYEKFEPNQDFVSGLEKTNIRKSVKSSIGSLLHTPRGACIRDDASPPRNMKQQF
jgi:hypothetical protein